MTGWTNKLDGIKKNEKKIKFMIVPWKPSNENEYVKLGTQSFEMVTDYTYVGTILTSKNALRPQI